VTGGDNVGASLDPALTKPPRGAMLFASDNWAGAAPEIVEAVAREASRSGEAYGVSAIDRAVAERFSEVFEREVAVFFVATGSAANALALASVAKPTGMVFCHTESHIVEDEIGGVEFLAGGARLVPLEGALGKLDPARLRESLARFEPVTVRTGQPMAISLTQLTEAGTAYSVDEIGAIAAIARQRRIPLHMDGARLANALVHLGVKPAEITWKAGVDILSFGATKNGCIAAEALVFFDPAKAADVPFLRKRAGHLFSKSRFVAAQFEAYLHDDLWLRLAAHANKMAERLRAGVGASGGAGEAWPTQGNEVFAVLKNSDAARLKAAGAYFYGRPAPSWTTRPIGADEQVVRLVTSFATTEAHVDEFVRILSADENAPALGRGARL
jgi:threonine aldolase